MFNLFLFFAFFAGIGFGASVSAMYRNRHHFLRSSQYNDFLNG